MGDDVAEEEKQKKKNKKKSGIAGQVKYSTWVVLKTACYLIAQ